MGGRICIEAMVVKPLSIRISKKKTEYGSLFLIHEGFKNKFFISCYIWEEVLEKYRSRLDWLKVGSKIVLSGVITGTTARASNENENENDKNLRSSIVISLIKFDFSKTEKPKIADEVEPNITIDSNNEDQF